MRVTFLGTGGAGGTPMISRGWGNCDPADPRNRRRRPSILIEDGETRLLVDTSPDLREQLLAAGVDRLSAVLYTHAHADHLHGIDDLREINRAMGRELPVHADGNTLAVIRDRFGYTVRPRDTEYIYRPLLVPHEVIGAFSVDGLQVEPFVQDHGWLSSLGYRVGPVAYSTDVARLPAQAFTLLQGVRVWIVACPVEEGNPVHASLATVLDWIALVRPERAYITHISPQLDHAALAARLPAGVEPAWDGLVVDTTALLPG